MCNMWMKARRILQMSVYTVDYEWKQHCKQRCLVENLNLETTTTMTVRFWVNRVFYTLRAVEKTKKRKSKRINQRSIKSGGLVCSCFLHMANICLKHYVARKDWNVLRLYGLSRWDITTCVTFNLSVWTIQVIRRNIDSSIRCFS